LGSRNALLAPLPANVVLPPLLVGGPDQTTGAFATVSPKAVPKSSDLAPVTPSPASVVAVASGIVRFDLKLKRPAATGNPAGAVGGSRAMSTETVAVIGPIGVVQV
jgi:hypothetical protein